MSNTKHTPGPWYEYDMGWSGQTAIAVKHANSNFLIVPAMNKGANARLIAAAPELLEALEAWNMSWTTPGLSEEQSRDMRIKAGDLTRAAIYKATGKKVK